MVDLQQCKKIKFLRISPHNNNFNQPKITALINQKKKKAQEANKKITKFRPKNKKKPKNINHCRIMLTLNYQQNSFFMTITIMYVVRKT